METDIYIKKLRRCRHIISPTGKSLCPICLKKRKLNAHHIVPKRLKTKNEYLKELRIKICQRCHDEIHPESKYIMAFRKLESFLKDLTGGEIENMSLWKEILLMTKNEPKAEYDHLEAIRKSLTR